MPSDLSKPVTATLLARFLFANIKQRGWRGEGVEVGGMPKEKCLPAKQSSASVRCRQVCEKRLNEVSIHSFKAGTN